MPFRQGFSRPMLNFRASGMEGFCGPTHDSNMDGSRARKWTWTWTWTW